MATISERLNAAIAKPKPQKEFEIRFKIKISPKLNGEGGSYEVLVSGTDLIDSSLVMRMTGQIHQAGSAFPINFERTLTMRLIHSWFGINKDNLTSWWMRAVDKEMKNG